MSLSIKPNSLGDGATIEYNGTTCLSVNSTGGVSTGALSATGPVTIAQGSAAFALNQINAYTNGYLYLNGNTNGLFINGTSSGADRMRVGLDVASGTNIISFDTNSTERARITSSGELLINQTTSDGVNKLQVKGGGYFGYPGEVQVKVHHTSANKILSLGADGATSYLLSNNGITFYVNNAASQMTLDSSGNLLVGYTSSNGSYKLQVNSQIFATSSTIATSDVRYKTDIQTITDGLAIIHKLRPVQFNWKEHPVHAFDRTHPTTGFIAQETLEALSGKPYAASIVKSNDCKLPDGTTEEFLGIAEGNLISIIVSAIQELSAKVTTLEEQLNAA